MLTAPFLRQARLDPAKVEHGEFPFGTVPFLAEDFELRFDSAVTILVGENGSAFLADLFADLG